MANANDYQVTFGYGDWDGVYYSKSRPHRGNDRACPSGTKIVIGATVIGETGNTGLTSGPHLHTQAGTDEWCQQTIDPTPYEFKGGKVIHAGWGSEWGNFIIIKVGSKYICYAHLSEINVEPGQVIKEEEMYKGKTAKQHHLEAKAWKRAATEARAAIEVLKSDISKMQQTISELKARPTREELDTAVKDLTRRLNDAQMVLELAIRTEDEVVDSIFEKIKSFFKRLLRSE